MTATGRVKTAVNALKAAGISATRGYPEGVIPHLEGVMAAVTVANSGQRQTKLAVMIYGPKGQECEQTAQQAANALRDKGFVCRAGACDFDGTSHLFSLKVTALWMETLHNRVLIADAVLPYATAFSAVQTRQVQQGEEAIVQGERVWTLAVQEWLPFGETVTQDEGGAFTLKVIHENCTEIYNDCYWLSITLEEGDGGLMRKRIARTWKERIIQEEP